MSHSPPAASNAAGGEPDAGIMPTGMKMRTSVWLSLLVLSAGIAPGHAQSLFETYFSKADGGKPCYARQYTAEHLAKNPRQQVTAIEVDFEPTNPDGVLNTAKRFELGFGVQKRGSTEWFTNAVYCSLRAGGFDCALEGDGGLFRLQPASGGGRLRLALTRDTIAIEGEKDFFEFGGKQSDDNVFLLYPADRKVCDASTADVKR
jgi:hypothetical protein